MAKGHHGHHHRKAAGGGVEEAHKKGGGEHEFNPGAPENKEAEDTKGGFARCGKARKAGGRVKGEKTKGRLDRKPRKHGGRVMAGGGSVLSAASKTSEARAGKSKGAVDKEDD